MLVEEWEAITAVCEQAGDQHEEGMPACYIILSYIILSKV